MELPQAVIDGVFLLGNMPHALSMRAIAVGVQAHVVEVDRAALCRGADEAARHQGRELDGRCPEAVGVLEAVPQGDGEVVGVGEVGKRFPAFELKFNFH